jgi:hypothetical protein
MRSILGVQVQPESAFKLIRIRISAIAPALPSHRDVVNVENAGAFFHLPPASVQS